MPRRLNQTHLYPQTVQQTISTALTNYNELGFMERLNNSHPQQTGVSAGIPNGNGFLTVGTQNSEFFYRDN